MLVDISLRLQKNHKFRRIDMRSLSLIVLAAVSFGSLALSGCSSCSQPPTEDRGTEVTKEGDMTCTSTKSGGKECVKK